MLCQNHYGSKHTLVQHLESHSHTKERPYKCSLCEDFDFCEKCELKNYQTEEHKHNFILIRNPKNVMEIEKKEEVRESSFKLLDSVIALDNYASECITQDLNINVITLCDECTYTHDNVYVL